MPYPNTTASVIVISQTSGSAVAGQYPFVERQISGSNLFLVTDSSGNLTGSTSIPGGSFTNLTITGALTASVISASTAITSAAATFTGAVTMSSTLSASGGITASAIQDAGTLTVVGTSTLGTTNITGLLSASGNVTASNIFDAGTLVVLGTSTLATLSASNISASTISASATFSNTGTVSGQFTVGTGITTNSLTASGIISASSGITASSINVINSIVDGGTLTVLGNTILGDQTSDSVRITGSLNQSGSYFILGAITASNISASGNISASVFVGAHTGSTFGTASWSTNSLTASNLVSTNSYQITNLTASNISASGNISASNLFATTNITSNGTLTVLGNTTLGDQTSDSVRITGSLNQSGSYFILGAITASGNISASGAIVASSFTGSFSGSIGNAVLASTASTVTVTDTTSGVGPYYITFVDGTSGARAVRTDSATLTWNATTSTLSSSGNLIGNVLIAGNSITSSNGGLLINNLSGPNAITINSTAGGVNSLISHSGSSGDALIISSTGPLNLTSSVVNVDITTQSTTWSDGAVVVDGGVGIGKNLNVSGSTRTLEDVYVGKNLVVTGSTTLYGDLTIYGSGSIVNISSSTVIIGDNRIQLNAFSPGGTNQRYAGIDVVDTGSSNNVTSSLLWDGLNNYWLLTNNQSGSPIVSSSAIILQGPTGSFGSENLLTVNNFLKTQTESGNLITSSLSEVAGVLKYEGTISGSSLTIGSSITAGTGSFTNLTVVTGSSPGVGTQVPAHPTSSGLPGQIEVDNNFIYVYTNNTWKRVPLSVWSL